MTQFYESHTFSNGIRLLHKQVTHTQIVHCGFIMDVGSRDEKADQQGLAHFWEHMAFKGTKKRKAYHIINRLESVGGELNAHTTKEKICFYASFLHKHYPKAIELLTDITFDSIFPENQIELERKVILEEMAMYLDSPDDNIQDEFDMLVFKNHPLGNNILGTKESVNTFKRDDFRNFVQANINTSQIIFSSIGNIPFKKVLEWGEKYIAQIPESQGQKQRFPFQKYEPQRIEKTHSASQAYCAMGRATYSIHHPKRLPFYMIHNILGGPSLNSRLSMALREKHGYVYSIESDYAPFTDTGLFAIYFATEEKHLQKSIALIHKELKSLRDNKLGVLQMHQAKEQLLGQIAMAEENNLNFMLMMAKSVLDIGKFEPVEEVFEEIRKIKAEDLQEIANEMLQEDSLSYLICMPE
jgi:predicted Zn-dependent peptidase